MSYDPEQFEKLIRQTLVRVNLIYDLDNAVQLLLLTASAESNFGESLWQKPQGPARGVYQMEEKTHDSLWLEFIFTRADKTKDQIIYSAALYYVSLAPGLYKTVNGSSFPSAYQLVGNLFYATVMARINYLRKPAPLPNRNNVMAMAEYWKKYWNTAKGKGTVEEAIKKYNRCVIGK